MTCDAGDVVLVWFPESNLQVVNRRPALVVMVNGLNTGLPQTIVAMITTNMARGGHPSRVVFIRSTLEAQAMGLLSDSVVMTDNLATVAHREIERTIGHCHDMRGVHAALRLTLGL